MPIGGNADMGAGLAQTRAKRVAEAGDLAKHTRENGQDITLRIIGTVFALLFGVTIFAAYGGASNLAWTSFALLIALLVTALLSNVYRSRRASKKRELDVEMYRSNLERNIDA